ncbi:MAG: hypothetical protein HWD83_02810 [Gammaproteobacteria bacterium]|nr:hypothetical protein [Gammaproteobacteria bacterium]
MRSLLLFLLSPAVFASAQQLQCEVTHEMNGTVAVQQIQIHYTPETKRAIVVINGGVASCDDNDQVCMAEKHHDVIASEEELHMVRVDHGDIGTFHHWDVSEITVDLNSMAITHANLSSFWQGKRIWEGECRWGKVAK